MLEQDIRNRRRKKIFRKTPTRQEMLLSVAALVLQLQARGPILKQNYKFPLSREENHRSIDHKPGLRTVPRTVYPLSSRSLTTHEAMNPLAPVTTTVLPTPSAISLSRLLLPLSRSLPPTICNLCVGSESKQLFQSPRVAGNKVRPRSVPGTNQRTTHSGSRC